MSSPFISLGISSWSEKGFGGRRKKLIERGASAEPEGDGGGGDGGATGKIVVGALQHNAGRGNLSGSVYVYDLDGTNEVKISASDGNFNHRFGRSVDVGNNKIFVGADGASSSGAVYVYNSDGTGETKITPSDGATSDLFGRSVAVGSNKIVVGSYGDDDNGAAASGSVYVYDLDGSNEVKITTSDAAMLDLFGYSVAAVGSNKLVAGAYNDDSRGSVYVYNLDGTGEVKITASDGYSGDEFGSAVAIGNDKVVVGAPKDDDDGGSSGAVYVYDLDGSNEVKITASDAATSDHFGHSVAIGSNKIVVGSYRDGNDLGSVYVYDLDGSNEVKITASDGASVDQFGYSVAVGSNKIVVGSYYDDDNGSNSGSVYVYNLDGTGEVKITASDGASNDWFGYSVAVG